MHDFVPQLCVLNNEPGARRQQQLRIHAYLFGGLAVRQAGVFYRVSSGSRNPRCQNLDMLIHITASLAPQPAQQASLCLAAQPAKLAARNSHQNHIRTAMDMRRRCHPSPPIGPHQAMRIEHEYERAGVLQYLAAWDVHRAVIFGRCEPKTGKAAFGRLTMSWARSHTAPRGASSGLSTMAHHIAVNVPTTSSARVIRGSSSSIHRNTLAGSIRSRFTSLSSSGKCSLRTTAPPRKRWRIALSNSARGTPPWASRSPGASLAKTWNDASLNPYFPY